MCSFPGFIPVIVSVCGQGPLQHRAIEEKGEEGGEGREGGGMDKKNEPMGYGRRERTAFKS